MHKHSCSVDANIVFAKKYVGKMNKQGTVGREKVGRKKEWKEGQSKEKEKKSVTIVSNWKEIVYLSDLMVLL